MKTIEDYKEIIKNYSGDINVISNMLLACKFHDIEYKTNFVNELYKYVNEVYGYEW